MKNFEEMTADQLKQQQKLIKALLKEKNKSTVEERKIEEKLIIAHKKL